MYEARQNKEKVLRTLSMSSHGNVQLHKIVDNRKYTTFDKRDVVQCSIWDSISGGSSIVGGLVSMITGGRDAYNAYHDYQHPTILLTNPIGLNMTNVTGSLEQINVGTYKAKIQGNLNPNVLPPAVGIRQGPPGTRRRMVEGGLNSIAGLLNMGAGVASLISGGKITAATLYGFGALSSGVAAGIRFWRSIRP